VTLSDEARGRPRAPDRISVSSVPDCGTHATQIESTGTATVETMRNRWPTGAAIVATVVALASTGCTPDGDTNDVTETGRGEPSVVLALPDSAPGDVIALRAADDDARVVEWIDRRAGTIRSVDLDDPDATTLLAALDVGTDGEQRGLLGHTVIDGVRYAAWTDPDTEHLLVGALTSDAPAGVGRIVWDAGGTAGGAVGGHLTATSDGRLILGIGQLTDWAKDHGSGAMLALDPLGPPDQEPVVLSDGYINPFAFVVVGDELWVADNAVGDDTERIGPIDLAAGSARNDRSDLARSDVAPRAPSAVVALPDGVVAPPDGVVALPDGVVAISDDVVAVCGFLDAELRAWNADPPGYGDALGPCLTGAVVLVDGTIVTATADGLVALTL
jgi:hypothetical protein